METRNVFRASDVVTSPLVQDSPAASPRLSGRRPLSLVTLLVAVVTFVVVVPPLTAVVAPASWLPASWLPGSWLPGSWLPASWLPASWLPASLRRWVPSPVAGQLGLVAGLLLLLADICQLGIHRCDRLTAPSRHRSDADALRIMGVVDL